jgi:hypothetical protein
MGLAVWRGSNLPVLPGFSTSVIRAFAFVVVALACSSASADSAR